MFFNTSGNKADTSFPSVMDIIVFWIDSFRSQAYCDTRPALSSNVSPFLGAAKAPRILFTAIGVVNGESRVRPSYVLSLFAVEGDREGYEYEDTSNSGCDDGEGGNVEEGDNYRSYPPVARYSIRGVLISLLDASRR